MVVSPPGGRERSQLSERVQAIEWYHTIELEPGIVTPGWFDHRPIVGRIPFPATLGRMRCLDVGTFNGFWAFEMERRGAEEVVAIDVLDPRKWDWPFGSHEETVAVLSRRMANGDGFEIARDCLHSTVKRLDRSVYDLDARDVGRFDLVYLGSLLVHLRDPVRALERIRAVCDGTLIVVDGIDLTMSLTRPRLPLTRLDGRGRPWWWIANAAGLARMVQAAGFDVLDGPRRVFIPTGPGRQRQVLHPRMLRTREARSELIADWLGDPHAIIVARPRA